MFKMSQKSLPILNKVGTSMVWYTTFFYKHYKWLSSQNLYMLYFLNKIFVYLDMIFEELHWIEFYSRNLYKTKRNSIKSYFFKERFSRPFTSYLININSKLLVFNLYYVTNLENFQELNRKSEVKIITKNQSLSSMSFKNLFFK